MTDAALEIPRRISHHIRDLSPGQLYDLVTHPQNSPFFLQYADQLAETEATALASDVERLETHLSVLLSIFARFAQKEAERALPLLNSEHLDLFLAATADSRKEQTFFDHLPWRERARFAYHLLVMTAILQDYRELVSVALGGLQPPIAPGAFARYCGPIRRTAGVVKSVSKDGQTATLELEEEITSKATYPTNELIITGRRFPLPDAYWVRILLEHLGADRYTVLRKASHEDETLWPYRWIFDRNEQRAFGLALLTRQHEPFTSPDVWCAQTQTALVRHVDASSTMHIDTVARAYEGATFFPDGDWLAAER